MKKNKKYSNVSEKTTSTLINKQAYSFVLFSN